MQSIIYLARPLLAAEIAAALTPTSQNQQNISDGSGNNPEVLVIYEHHHFIPSQWQSAGFLPSIQLQAAPPLSAQQTSQIFKNVRDHLPQFAHTLTAKNQPIIDNFFYHYNHWFDMRFVLHQTYRTVQVAAQRIINAIEPHLKQGNETQSPTTLHIYLPHDYAYTTQLLQKQWPFAQIVTEQAKKQNKQKTPVWVLLQYLLLFTWRVLLGSWQWFVNRVYLNKKHLVLISPEYIQPILNINNPLTTQLGDNYIGYLLELMKNRNDVLLLSEIQPPSLTNGRSKGFKRHFTHSIYPKITLNAEVWLLLAALKPSTWQAVKRFLRPIKSIALPPNAPTHQQVMLQIVKNHRIIFAQSVFRAVAANLFFKHLKNKTQALTISGINEHGLANRPFFELGRLHKLKTIGFQHAVFNIAYATFHSKDAALNPVPDITAVWGDYFKNQLLRQPVYHAQNVEVLGQIRTDIIPKLQHLQKSQIHPKLPNHKPLIVYASQQYGGLEAEVRYKLASDFMQLANEFKETCSFVIKPHYLETNLDFFETVAHQHQNPDYLLLQDELYRLLAAADMVITYNSTVGAEAVYFGKQLLVADYYGADVMDYIKSGVGFGFNNYQQLKQAVEGILLGNTRIDLQTQANFVQQRAYLIDGQTAQRYQNLIIAAGQNHNT
ncbi:MAG: hypothetical protein IPI59_09490 [Sphingobacteriales bacterium]|jgi:hypothetical protein|nr:hypothetical protein [Sphingobacteriales bacterium]MBP9140752.1 hypothetical protein [Chitinophagales bacterium]MDA0197871.1 hypothetical protein [Bacteroidota bacterium]MBK6889719.1 hypothetical protein [Sphingobacteriales bacterium]MBK7527766.1 hypothetical protein [Sphingobacteriales bacterium]